MSTFNQDLVHHETSMAFYLYLQFLISNVKRPQFASRMNFRLHIETVTIIMINGLKRLLTEELVLVQSK